MSSPAGPAFEYRKIAPGTKLPPHVYNDPQGRLVDLKYNFVDIEGNLLPEDAVPFAYEEGDNEDPSRNLDDPDDGNADSEDSVVRPKTPPTELAGSVRTPLAAQVKIPTKKNPFTSSFVWDRESFAAVTVNAAPLTYDHETTNDQTRMNNPEHRYWKCTLDFSCAGYNSDTIRIVNVSIPYSPSRNYGQTYVYAALPMWLREAVATATKLRRPTNVDDASLTINSEQWWKTVNFKPDAFGAATPDGKFHNVPLAAYFSASKCGLIATLVMKFQHKTGTVGRQPLTPSEPGKVTIDVIRGYIHKLNVDMAGPIRILKNKPEVIPRTHKGDLADEGLIAQLTSMGLDS